MSATILTLPVMSARLSVRAIARFLEAFGTLPSRAQFTGMSRGLRTWSVTDDAGNRCQMRTRDDSIVHVQAFPAAATLSEIRTHSHR